MRKSIFASVAAGTLLAAGIAAPTFAVEEGMTELSVLHGIPDLTVDVYVNGELTLDDFAPGDLAGPLSLEPGTYTVAITAADAADDSSPVLGPIDLPLEAGMSYTAVAHLLADGTPTASLFTNDISETADGEGRLTVRHAAAAPAVDIWVNGAVLFPGLENPNEVMGDVPADTYEAAVSLAGTETVVLGPADVSIEAGVNTIVYAWGSAEAGNLALAVQTVATMQPAPVMEEPAPVETEEPVVDDVVEDEDGGANTALIIAIIAALAAAAIIATVVAKRRKK
ncbi:MAG: hypothetical protein CVT64_03585 [Actinobacteria bacterium HGW-Actinobacteria-4]|nr:MAG: hypothetical protein CVT64_03585 [Actinobacteria bacterium HGW-Actinobacteria-4]